MKKRIASVIIGMNAIAAIMAGGATVAAADQPVELNLYHSWSTETTRGEVLTKLIDEFNQEHDGEIKVNVETNSDFPAYQEKVKTMLSTDTAPDIFHYNYNPNDLSYFESGKLMDFSSFMDDEWKARFEESDLETLTYNDQLLSIPFESAGAVLWYNKDAFAEVGYNE